MRPGVVRDDEWNMLCCCCPAAAPVPATAVSLGPCKKPGSVLLEPGLLPDHSIYKSVAPIASGGLARPPSRPAGDAATRRKVRPTYKIEYLQLSWTLVCMMCGVVLFMLLVMLLAGRVYRVIQVCSKLPPRASTADVTKLQVQSTLRAIGAKC
jgi:hypothetical protein